MELSFSGSSTCLNYKDIGTIMISELKEIGTNCWVIEETKCSPLGRRMTIIKCGSELFIHSCIKLEETTLSTLTQLGHIRWILVPNFYHMKDVLWYSQQFPDADIIATTPLLKKLYSIGIKKAQVLPDYCSESLLTHITFKIMESVKHTEIECFHDASKTLILTDLIFNLDSHKMGLIGKLFHRINQSDRLGITRLFKTFFMLNRDILKEELHELMGLNFTTIIMSHGTIITDHAKEKLSDILETL